MGSVTDSWVAEMDGRGVRRDGSALRPVREAATVRIRDGEVLVSDGPFAETKEQVAGYDVVECSDLDEAIEVASKHPVARYGAVEVRPFDSGGWWRSADRRGPGGDPEYLMIHCLAETAELSPADNCDVPGSPAAREQQAWDAETEASGVKLAGGRLQPTSAARTVRVRDGEVLVTDGPFAETKELVAGYWIWQVRSMDEAVEWLKRCPNPMPGESDVEIRPVYELTDLGENFTPEAREKEERLRELIAKRKVS
jgi:hypothetical protein